jgi:hypothetical protein
MQKGVDNPAKEKHSEERYIHAVEVYNQMYNAIYQVFRRSFIPAGDNDVRRRFQPP